MSLREETDMRDLPLLKVVKVRARYALHRVEDNSRELAFFADADEARREAAARGYRVQR